MSCVTCSCVIWRWTAAQLRHVPRQRLAGGCLGRRALDKIQAHQRLVRARGGIAENVHDGRGKRLRRLADIDETPGVTKPLDADGRGDYGGAPAQGLDDLALDAAAEPERHDRDLRREIKRLELRIGDESGDRDIRPGQRRDLVRRERAGNIQMTAGNGRSNARPNLLREPQHGIHVRPMAEAPYKKKLLRAGNAGGEQALSRGLERRRLVEEGRDGLRPRAGKLGADEIGLLVGGIVDHVALRPHPPFEPLAFDHLGPGLGPAGNRQFVGEPPEMDVMPVEQDPRPAQVADGADVIERHARAAEEGIVEMGPVQRRPIAEGAALMKIVEHLDPVALQRHRVTAVEIHVLRAQGDVEARGLEQHQVVAHRARAGIAVRLRDVVIDEEDMRSPAAAVARQRQASARREVLGLQRRAPTLKEAAVVLKLIGLGAGRDTPAVAHPLVVDDGGERLIDATQPRRAHAEGKIAVLAIGRCEGFVETAELVPDVPGDGDGGAGDIIRLLHIVELGCRGVLVATIVPGGAVAPDDATGLLQRAVRVDQLRAGEADRLVGAQRFHQLIEPARQRDGVVVEEDQHLAACRRGGGIAIAQEAEVLLVAPVMHHTADGRDQRSSAVRRGVVGDDDLEARPGLGAQQRLQAAQRMDDLVVHGDDDGRRACVRRVLGARQPRQLGHHRFQVRRLGQMVRTYLARGIATEDDIELPDGRDRAYVVKRLEQARERRRQRIGAGMKTQPLGQRRHGRGHAPLARAITQEMNERVHARLLHVGVSGQIPFGIEHRPRIAALLGTVLEIVQQRVDAGGPHIGILVDIPGRVEQAGAGNQHSIATPAPHRAQARDELQRRCPPCIPHEPPRARRDAGRHLLGPAQRRRQTPADGGQDLAMLQASPRDLGFQFADLAELSIELEARRLDLLAAARKIGAQRARLRGLFRDPLLRGLEAPARACELVAKLLAIGPQRRDVGGAPRRLVLFLLGGEPERDRRAQSAVGSADPGRRMLIL